MKKKGFSLVELLVVIAIIGTLATIVLINLNKARDKAKNAAIKAALSELRPSAAMWYEDNNSSYQGFCEVGSTDVDRIKKNILENGQTLVCTVSADNKHFCGESAMHPDPVVYWCVDDSGVSEENANKTCGEGSPVVNAACD